MIQKEHERIQNDRHQLQIVVMAENIRTPENAGMIMRLSEAFGVEKIYFVGKHAIDLTTKVKRASRNTYKTIEYEFVNDGKSEISLYKNAGYQPIAIEITEKSRPIYNLAVGPFNKILLVVGSERQGITEGLLNLCQYHYHIPMFGQNSSINVVNALAIGLFKVTEN